MPDEETIARPPYAPRLSDGIVTLRAHKIEDVEGVRERCADPEAIRWTSVPPVYDLRDAVAFVESRPAEWEAGTSLGFAIEDAEGYAGSVDLRPTDAYAEIGFALHPRARGRGVMTRAVRLIVTWGFEVLDVDVVQWRATVGNWASRRVAWAAGFQHRGTVPGLIPRRDGGAEDGWIATIGRGEAMTPAHAWFAPPTLQDLGRRVVLRPHRAEDVPRLAEGCSDPVTRRWLPWLPTPYTEYDATRHLEQILEDHARGRGVYWAMADPADGQLIGEIAVTGLVRTPDHSPEIGYWTHPDARNRGLTSLAVRAVARHAVIATEDGGLGVHRLGLRAATSNAPSRAVAVRAGFRHCGTEREALVMADGSHGDQACYELLADEIGPPEDDGPGERPALGWPGGTP